MYFRTLDDHSNDFSPEKYGQCALNFSFSCSYLILVSVIVTSSSTKPFPSLLSRIKKMFHLHFDIINNYFRDKNTPALLANWEKVRTFFSMPFQFLILLIVGIYVGKKLFLILFDPFFMRILGSFADPFHLFACLFFSIKHPLTSFQVASFSVEK